MLIVSLWEGSNYEIKNDSTLYPKLIRVFHILYENEFLLQLRNNLFKKHTLTCVRWPLTRLVLFSIWGCYPTFHEAVYFDSEETGSFSAALEIGCEGHFQSCGSQKETWLPRWKTWGLVQVQVQGSGEPASQYHRTAETGRCRAGRMP